MEKETFKLRTPITAHGETLHELQVRRPTAQECREIRAFPYTLGQDGLPVAAVDVAAKYICRCAAIPESSVNQLHLGDLNHLTWKIIGFFVSQESEPELDQATD